MWSKRLYLFRPSLHQQYKGLEFRTFRIVFETLLHCVLDFNKVIVRLDMIDEFLITIDNYMTIDASLQEHVGWCKKKSICKYKFYSLFLWLINDLKLILELLNLIHYRTFIKGPASYECFQLHEIHIKKHNPMQLLLVSSLKYEPMT